MPKAALSNVSLKQLVAELNKRKAKLATLIKQRDALDAQIKALEGLDAPAAVSAPKATKGKKTPKRATGKPLAVYVQEALATATKGLSIKEIEAKVRKAGYPTKAAKLYNPIFAIVSKGFKKLAKGVYGLKVGKKAVKAAPVAKPAAKPVKAKARKRSFACPTCKQVFASGPMLGVHYKAEPTHRAK